ncbi:MAG: hypothetical protein DMF61_18905 [Blastocatellia bacterium AA13]|nr:MAG: hypothetical protein DMF61_18905 [Blastocatellia bacterium AA13]
MGAAGAYGIKRLMASRYFRPTVVAEADGRLVVWSDRERSGYAGCYRSIIRGKRPLFSRRLFLVDHRAPKALP